MLIGAVNVSAAGIALLNQLVMKITQVFRAKISGRIMTTRGIKMAFTGSPYLVGLVPAECLYFCACLVFKF